MSQNGDKTLNERNNNLLNYDISFQDIKATPPRVFYKKGGKIEKLLNKIFEREDDSEEDIEFEEENEDTSPSKIRKILNFPFRAMSYTIGALLVIWFFAIIAYAIGYLGWALLGYLYESIIDKKFWGIVQSLFVIIPVLLYLYVKLYDSSKARKLQRRKQAQIIKELLKVNNNNPQLLKEYIDLTEDEDYVWTKFDPDWNLTDFYKKLTIVDFVFLVLSFLAFTFGLIIFVYILSISTFASMDFSAETIYEVLIIMYLLIFTVWAIDRYIHWLDPTIKLPSYRDISLKDRKVGVILFLIPTLLFTFILYEEDGLVNSTMLALIITLLYFGMMILLVSSFLPMVEIIVREARYVSTRNKIKEHLSDVIRLEDLKHTSMLANDQLSGVDNMEYLVVRSMLQGSLHNINQLPIVPNNNFGIWLLTISVIFTGVSVVISSWEFIINSIFPYLRDLIDSIDV